MNADLSASQLQNGKFNFSALSGVDFRNSDLSGSVFNGCDLRDTKFDDINLSQIELYRAAMIGASYKEVKLYNVLFDKSG